MLSHAPALGGSARPTAVPPSGFVVGDWHVVPDLNEVRSGARTLHVRPQLMDLLVYLARNSGRTVSRDELQAHVWPQQPFITLTALPRCIAELRQTLGDCATGPTLIQTVPKRGYRLIAQVRPMDEWPVGALQPGGHVPAAAAPPIDERAVPATGATVLPAISETPAAHPSIPPSTSWTLRAGQLLSHVLDIVYARIRS